MTKKRVVSAPAGEAPPPSEAVLAAQREAIYTEAKHNYNIALDSLEATSVAALGVLTDVCHGWFSGQQGFDRVNFDGDTMLIVTELAEAVEAERTSADSDKIPGFSGVEEEFADALVRLLHCAGKYNLRLGPAFFAKMRMNLTRPYKHGKKY